MNDDSVSIIEPLSIYSNVSPPGELVDTSFPHSAFSVQQSRMQPQNSTASQTQASGNHIGSERASPSRNMTN